MDWIGDAIEFVWGIGIATVLRCARSVSSAAKYRPFFSADGQLGVTRVSSRRYLAKLDRELFRALAHPWLLVDDAHADVPGLFAVMSEEFMQKGDYFVLRRERD